MIIALLVMTAVSFSMRYTPFVLFERLKNWPLLEKLAAALPICVMILLVGHTLEYTGCGVPEAAALLAVVVAQLTFRNVLASMGIGVLLHQLLMRL